jgi:hypothetical protein
MHTNRVSKINQSQRRDTVLSFLWICLLSLPPSRIQSGAAALFISFNTAGLMAVVAPADDVTAAEESIACADRMHAVALPVDLVDPSSMRLHP